MPVKVVFLGTGTSQGVPVIACSCEVCRSFDPRDKRLRTSIMVETGGQTIVIDTGPDFRQQMLREKVKSLDAVLFTHEHKDHTAGLDDIRAFNFFLKKEIDVYCTNRVEDALRNEFAYIFAEIQYPGVPQIRLHNINGEPFDLGGVNIQPIEVMHYKLPVLGFRIGDFVYITDANMIPENQMHLLRNAKVLVLNALRKQTHISHFSLKEAIDLVNEVKPERAYFTHISHQLGLHHEVEEELPDNINLAYDGLKIEV